MTNHFTCAARAPLPSGRVLHLPLVALLLALTACRDAHVAAYRIPKEKETAAAASAPAPAAAPEMTVAARPVSELTWSAPSAWKAKPPSSMRRGSFDVGEGTGPLADLAITAFPGNVGGDLANVNRWRGQLDLPPITGAGLLAALQPVSAAHGLAIELADIAGGAADNPQRMLGRDRAVCGRDLVLQAHRPGRRGRGGESALSRISRNRDAGRSRGAGHVSGRPAAGSHRGQCRGPRLALDRPGALAGETRLGTAQGDFHNSRRRRRLRRTRGQHFPGQRRGASSPT
ncbi:MAG: hypothetical protein WDM96_07805 [Lacunisphaera sp.]